MSAPGKASPQTSRSRSPTSRCLSPHRVLKILKILQYCFPKFSFNDRTPKLRHPAPLSCSGMRCPRQRSLRRPWSSRRTLACLDLVKQDFQTSLIFPGHDLIRITKLKTYHPFLTTLQVYDLFRALGEAKGSRFLRKDAHSESHLGRFCHSTSTSPNVTQRHLTSSEFLDFDVFEMQIALTGSRGDLSPSRFAKSHRKRTAMEILRGTGAFGIAPQNLTCTKSWSTN